MRYIKKRKEVEAIQYTDLKQRRDIEMFVEIHSGKEVSWGTSRHNEGLGFIESNFTCLDNNTKMFSLGDWIVYDENKDDYFKIMTDIDFKNKYEEK